MSNMVQWLLTLWEMWKCFLEAALGLTRYTVQARACSRRPTVGRRTGWIEMNCELSCVVHRTDNVTLTRPTGRWHHSVIPSDYPWHRLSGTRNRPECLYSLWLVLENRMLFWSLWKSFFREDMNDFVNTVADFIELDFLPDGRHSRVDSSETFEQLGTKMRRTQSSSYFDLLKHHQWTNNEHSEIRLI